MSSAEKVLFVPLASNAHALVDGEASENVDTVRRRLKFASITFDKVVLESGSLVVNAGPGGAVALRHHEADARFQTHQERAEIEATGFTFALGTQDIPGQTAKGMRTFIESSNTFGWAATLQPFAQELPGDCDWIGYGTITDKDGAAATTAKAWRRIDERNNALTDLLPEQIARGVVLKAANADLALGAHARLAIMQDGLHRRVLASRFEDLNAAGWQATAFALPIHLPDVSELDWEVVARIRRHKYMADFRKIIHDIETEAISDASGADVRDVVHRAFARYLAEAVPKVDGLGAMAKDMVASLAIGRMASVVTAALGGPAALPVAMAMDVGPTALEGGIDRVRGRRHRWTSVYQELTAAVASTMERAPGPPMS